MLDLLPSVVRKTKKRVGRGPASGKGKTSAKGHKGQNARSGGKRYAGFEGGQTRLMKRLPKFPGFASRQTPFQVVNLAKLEQFDNGTEVTFEILQQKGFIKDADKKVKILGDGSFTKKITVQCTAISASAKASIEKSGGKIQVQ